MSGAQLSAAPALRGRRKGGIGRGRNYAGRGMTSYRTGSAGAVLLNRGPLHKAGIRRTAGQSVTKEPAVMVWFPLTSIAKTSKPCSPGPCASMSSSGSFMLVLEPGRVI
jgi:hypothetical protein